MRLSSSFTERFSDRVLEAAPIGWQLFVRSSSLRDQSASLTTFETFATRLLAQALNPLEFLYLKKYLGANVLFPLSSYDDLEDEEMTFQALEMLYLKGMYYN